MQRCVNDMFGGECLGSPEIIEEVEHGLQNPKDRTKKGTSWTKSKCALDPKTCGYHRPFSQVVQEVPGLGSGVRIRKVGEEPKKCVKKKKKESLQGSFL